MLPVQGYAAPSAKSPLAPFAFERREVGPHDVLIDIAYCGVCHSDLHQVRDEWGGSRFPMVPGHEIVGTVAKVGSSVRRFKTGDRVGVGCFVDSCRTCPSCKEGLEQYCDKGMVATYNSLEKDGKTPTQGGYATRIVVDESYILRLPETIPFDKAAPLLCAGITTYSPLRHWGAGPGKNIAVVGLGGLGHMAVKLAAAMGAEVTVLSSSERKRQDALKLGAHQYAATSLPETFSKYANHFDLIIDTISAPHDLNKYASLLRRDGTMVLLGVPEAPPELQAFSLISKRRAIAGSLIGGIKETQEMLDFCGSKGIGAEVEVIPIEQINQAYERMLKSDVRYRFVIDIDSLRRR